MERTPQGPQHRKRASVVLRSLISARNSKTAGAEQLVPSNLPENASNDFLEAKLAPAWASPIPPRDQQTTKSPKKHINQPSPMLTIEADKNNGERRPRHLKTLSTSAIQTTLGLGDKALRPSKADNMRPGPTPTLNRHRVQRSLGTLSDMMSPKAHSQAASGEKRPRDKENVCPTAGPQDTFDVPIYRQFCSQNTLSSGPGPSPVARGKDVELVVKQEEPCLQPETESAFEAMLDARNIPETMRINMRGLTSRIKVELVKKHSSQSSEAIPTIRTQGLSLFNNGLAEEKLVRKSSDERIEKKGGTGNSKSKLFTFSRPGSPSKVKKDTSPRKTLRERPVSYHGAVSYHGSAKELLLPPGKTSYQTKGSQTTMHNCATADDFIMYLQRVDRPEEIEVAMLHKLRLLLRNETVAWVQDFESKGGMTEVMKLLQRTMAIEWREDHEDQVLHEALLCLKGICTTDFALQRLEAVETELFPPLLAMLFDSEHRGPSEFSTRGLIINLLFVFLSAARPDPVKVHNRAQSILSHLRGPQPAEDARPVQFVLDMHQPRPYRTWCQEISNVTKEAFWVFSHHLNVIPLPESQQGDTSNPRDYTKAFFPVAHPPVPAAPYVGGVEWEATNYLAAHLELLNALISSISSSVERNTLRAELRASGFEKVMSAKLRTCREKFYGSVHAGLKTWIAAAAADGWGYTDVRFGVQEAPGESTVKSSGKEAVKQLAPKLEFESPGCALGGSLHLDPFRDDEWKL